MSETLPSYWAKLNFTDCLDIEGGTQPPKKEFLYEETTGYIRLLQIRDFGKKPVPTYIPNGEWKPSDEDIQITFQSKLHEIIYVTTI